MSNEKPEAQRPDDKQATSGNLDQEQAMTCDALCSLGLGNTPTETKSEEGIGDSVSKRKPSTSSKGCCAKQLQLPMFLSKTYHMIDKCNTDVATWSESGDNFVVKDLDKFAKDVLPMYFKHSNFSSFARQLNFYGFRKLRSDPILTSDVDPSTACYVRFYHESFQRGKPELLQQIKRATKAEQHSKDDVESLRMEISGLKDQLRTTVSDYDRKLAELSYECNRRITSMNAEYDKLLTLVTKALGPEAIAAATVAALPPEAGSDAHVPVNAGLLHSLSQAAVSLQNNAQANLAKASASTTTNGKRPAEPSGDGASNDDLAKVPRTEV